MDMFAGFSQGASRDVGRITISPIPPLTGLKGGEAQLHISSTADDVMKQWLVNWDQPRLRNVL
ncbi:TPA: hypothetical protein ACH3X1_003081 [Trebouxia sp. C0004]